MARGAAAQARRRRARRVGGPRDRLRPAPRGRRRERPRRDAARSPPAGWWRADASSAATACILLPPARRPASAAASSSARRIGCRRLGAAQARAQKARDRGWSGPPPSRAAPPAAWRAAAPAATPSSGRSRQASRVVDERGHAGEAARPAAAPGAHQHRLGLVAGVVAEQQVAEAGRARTPPPAPHSARAGRVRAGLVRGPARRGAAGARECPAGRDAAPSRRPRPSEPGRSP